MFHKFFHIVLRNKLKEKEKNKMNKTVLENNIKEMNALNWANVKYSPKFVREFDAMMKEVREYPELRTDAQEVVARFFFPRVIETAAKNKGLLRVKDITNGCLDIGIGVIPGGTDVSLVQDLICNIQEAFVKYLESDTNATLTSIINNILNKRTAAEVLVSQNEFSVTEHAMATQLKIKDGEKLSNTVMKNGSSLMAAKFSIDDVIAHEDSDGTAEDCLALDDDFAEDIASREHALYIMQELKKVLSKTEYAVFTAVILKDMSVRDMADILQMEEKKVRGIYNYSKKKAHDYFTKNNKLSI
jgi:DNA-directed RNA polymerase specialized sigma24 family protein